MSCDGTVRIEFFDYELPVERIAQRPVEPRDISRLLVVSPNNDPLVDRRVADLATLLPDNALVIFNNTRVFKARLLGRKAGTGGKVELLLVRRVSPQPGPGLDDHSSIQRWRAMGKASNAFRFPATVMFGDPASLVAVIQDRAEDGLLDVALATNDGSSVTHAINRLGHVPLPPYIHRADDEADGTGYQTVYAAKQGAIAAPTAGLHFTHRLIGAMSARGIELASITLHVGLGTFQPVTVPDLDDHPMHEEYYEIPNHTAHAVAAARERGAPVIAIGTTCVRALEAAADPERAGCIAACHARTRLLIQPGYEFRVVDGMLTNFHLPKSTLLALVCAMGGTERVLAAYRHAVCTGYRFYSYGDAMLVWRSGAVGLGQVVDNANRLALDEPLEREPAAAAPAAAPLVDSEETVAASSSEAL